MCLLVDANKVSSILQEDQDSKPILEWLESPGSHIVLGGTKLRNEYQRHSRFLQFLNELARAGKVKIANDDRVDREQQAIVAAGILVSDDPHIIALARISGCRLIYSADISLHDDFKNPRILTPKGKVYQRSNHKRLLRSAPPCNT